MVSEVKLLILFFLSPLSVSNTFIHACLEQETTRYLSTGEWTDEQVAGEEKNQLLIQTTA